MNKTLIARFEQELEILLDHEDYGALTLAETVGLFEIVKQRLILGYIKIGDDSSSD
jgi:hypothetical protein